MSICAFCAWVVSSMRMGSAWALISSSLGLPFGYCRTVTLVMVPPFRVSWTCTGPHSVEATDPVTVEVAEEAAPEARAPDPEPLPPEPLPDAVEVDPVPTFDVPPLTGAAELDPAASVLEVEVWYPKRSTTAERLLRNHRVMRLMRSPREGLEMEPAGRQTGVGQGAVHEGGPVLRAAQEHVPLGDVGD